MIEILHGRCACCAGTCSVDGSAEVSYAGIVASRCLLALRSETSIANVLVGAPVTPVSSTVLERRPACYALRRSQPVQAPQYHNRLPRRIASKFLCGCRCIVSDWFCSFFSANLNPPQSISQDLGSVHSIASGLAAQHTSHAAGHFCHMVAHRTRQHIYLS